MDGSYPPGSGRRGRLRPAGRAGAGRRGGGRAAGAAAADQAQPDTEGEPAGENDDGGRGTGAVEEGGGAQQPSTRAGRQQLAQGPGPAGQHLGGGAAAGERVADQHHDHRAEGEPGVAEQRFQAEQGQRGGGDAQRDGAGAGQVGAVDRAEPELQDGRQRQTAGDREGEGAGDPPAGALEQVAEQGGGEQAAHDQRQGSGGQAGAAGVVGGQGDEVAHGDRRAGALGLAERGRHALQGLGDRGAGGGGGDDLRGAGADVDRPVDLPVADQPLGRGGGGDRGEVEGVRHPLLEGGGDLARRGGRADDGD